MSSVTTRVNQVKQPAGGYLPVDKFERVYLDDDLSLKPKENIPPTIIGLVVDYMTRYISGDNKEEAFKISLKGAKIAILNGKTEQAVLAVKYLNTIKGLDNESIIAASNLCRFDTWYRATKYAKENGIGDELFPDTDTIENIRILINRSLNFFKKYGPIKTYGFTFERLGYTDIVTSGDGDFLTEDTLWDFKVSKYEPDIKNTLQLLMYQVMGKHSEKEEFLNICNIGLFNPRLNIAYKINMDSISDEIINEIETKIIGYKEN